MNNNRKVKTMFKVYIASQQGKAFAYYDAANEQQANARASALRDKHKGKGITITVEGLSE